MTQKPYDPYMFQGERTGSKYMQEYLFGRTSEEIALDQVKKVVSNESRLITLETPSTIVAKHTHTAPVTAINILGQVVPVDIDKKYSKVEFRTGHTSSTEFTDPNSPCKHTNEINLTTEKKDTNPKDAVGIRKVAFSTVPQTVIAEVAVGMMEGARKYGRHNWRAADARASVYFDATLRHLLKWYEGEDIDPDSGLSHIAKAITSLVVLRDAMINDKWNDDRPPKIPENFWNDIQARVDEIFVKYPTALDPITEWSMRNSMPVGDKS